MSFDKALTGFINGWIGLIALLNVLGIIGIFLVAPTALSAIVKIQEVYDPFNLANFAAELFSLAPAIGAYVWRDNRRKRFRKSS
jgi:hypothetical protein